MVLQASGSDARQNNKTLYNEKDLYNVFGFSSHCSNIRRRQETRRNHHLHEEI
jgi:hypothetical protein